MVIDAPGPMHVYPLPMGIFDAPEAKPYVILGNQLLCLICKHDKFWNRNAQINTSAMEFMNMGWANESATCFECEKCGYIHWFVKK